MKEHKKTSSSDGEEYLKFIAVILGILTISIGIFNAVELNGATEFLRTFMAVFFIVFAGFKLAGYKMFVVMFQGYDILARRSKLYAQLYPLIELCLGFIYLLNILPGARDWLVLIIFGIGSIGVVQEIYHKRSGVYCACLGNIIKLPLSTVSLVEDITMAAMAGWMITA